jgi:carbon storage regulator CsrA
MLMLSRKPNEEVVLLLDESDSPPRVTVRIVEVKGQTVRLAFDAPAHVGIFRDELLRRIERNGG